MQRFITMISIVLTPFLVGFVIAIDPEEVPQTPAEQPAALEKFVSQLEAVVDAQIEEIARLLPMTGIPVLRRDHEAWKAARDPDHGARAGARPSSTPS
jgi:hypothetical protein